jgi:hypothetical protein
MSLEIAKNPHPCPLPEYMEREEDVKTGREFVTAIELDAV